MPVPPRRTHANQIEGEHESPAILAFVCFFKSINRSSADTAFSLALAAFVAQTPAPPVTRQDNVKEMIHGVEIVDPYRWLEDQDARRRANGWPRENAYTHSLLDGLPMRATGFKRLMEMFHATTP